MSGCVGPINVAGRFIIAHELATGVGMDGHQRNAINGYVKRLSGIGTEYGSNLLKMFVEYGTTLMPCCPSNDSTASAAGYQIDLLSATQQGEFLNFLPEDITVMGVKGGSSSAKIFKTFKGPIDYPLLSGFDFFYIKEKCVVSSTATHKVYQDNTNNTYLVPRHYSNGWVYSVFNGNFDAGLGNGKIHKGLCGLLNREGVLKSMYVDGHGLIYPNYGGYSSTPYTNNGTYFKFHDGLWLGEISLYSVRAPELTNEQIYDLIEATNWYQDNVLSNASRKLVI